MTKPFYIPDTVPEHFAAVVMATSYEHPFQDRQEVEAELTKRGVLGEVLIDLLLANASPADRYYVIPFRGGKLGRHSMSMAPTLELQSFSFRAFLQCPQVLDSILLLTKEARAEFPEKLSFRGCGTSALYDEVQRRATAQGRSFEAVAHALTTVGFEAFDSRIFHESPQKVLAEYESALAAWSGQDTTRWFVHMPIRTRIRLSLTAKEYGQSTPEFAFMCLAWHLAGLKGLSS